MVGNLHGNLFGLLADVDDAESPELAFARMDPDMAIWIRRIRELPEPKPKKGKRKNRKR